MSLVGTWLLNESLVLPSEVATYALDFKFLFSAHEYDSDNFRFDTYQSRMRLKVGIGYVLYAYKNVTVGYAYTYPESRYIVITGGNDAENDDLASWFESNAVRLDTPVYKSRYIEYLLSADAIRAKASSSAQMQWKTGRGLHDAINSIELGTDTSGGTAWALDIKEGKIAYSQGFELVGTLANANGVSF